MEENSEIALDIVTSMIAEVTNKYAVCKSNNKIQKYKEKLQLLEKIQNEIYMNNEEIILKIINKNKRGLK